MKRHFLSALAALALAPVGFAIVDLNQNGISDFWEKDQNNGELFSETFDPQADSDSDGWTNAQEAAAGTNPFDPNPPDGIIRPEIVHVPAVLSEPDEEGYTYVITPEAVTVTWPTIPDKQYTLLFSPDLAEGSWIPVGNPFIGNGNEVTYSFQVSGSDKRFWRVKAEDADTDGDTLTDIEERLIGSSVYLADTDGDGLNDAEAFAAGMNPSGDGSDEDGDGIPDNELYSVVFEVQHEYHSMPYGVGWASYDDTDEVHRYLTYEDTEKYSVSGSARYSDVTDAEHVWTYTHLVSGTIPEDGQPVSSEQGTTFYDWKSSHGTTLGEGESLHEDDTVTTVDGPTITATQIKTVTTDTTPWTVKKDGNVVRSGSEVITITEQADLSDETTYPQFWNNHVKSRTWVESPPVECGPLEWMEYNRAYFGDAEAAEYIRDRFLNHDFGIFGNVSDPGTAYPDYGSDDRVKSLRWRWIKFNPQSPFGFEYAAPPATLSKKFHLLVSQRDFLDTRDWSSNDPIVDDVATKGIVEIECGSGEGGTYWQTVPLTKFDSFKLEDPVELANIDFSKWGYSQVWFGNLPHAIIPGSEITVSADDHETIVVLEVSDRNGDPEGSLIEWQIDSGSGGTLQETETTVKDGFATVKLTTSTNKDASYVVKARIKRFGAEGPDIGASSPWIKSPEIKVIAGKPHAFAFATTKSSYHSDGTDTSEITATITDQYGNLVEDDTSVSWAVDQSPTSPFVSKDESTVDGIAKAVLRAPLIPDDQVAICSAGDKQDTVTVTVQGVTGAIFGNVSLDISAGGQSTITVNANAADGTPVYWTSSNGEITAESTMADGVATATLSTVNGRLGTAVVTATVGDHLFYTQGAFSSSSGLAIGADHPVLIADATADGIHTPTFLHGIARSIPYFASTPIRVKGPANGVVQVDIQASLPLVSWAFDQAAQNVTLSADGLHGMTLTNAVIDEDVMFSGAGSLALDGNGSGGIPDSSQFHFTDQFNASILLRPNQATAATLVEKVGSWLISQLADGSIQASVTTGTDSYSVTTDGPVSIDKWTRLEVDFRFDRLRIKLDDRVAGQTTTSGTLLVTSNPIAVGSGFHGNLDALSFRSEGDAGSRANLAGLGAGNSLQLDANGEGAFTITSTGNANAGDLIHISINAAGSGSNGGSGFMTLSNPLDNLDVAEAVVAFADAVHWDTSYDTVMSFIGGDPATTQGTVSSIAGGFCVVGDVGSCAKNLWRMTGWTDKKPNYVELSLGGLGILTTFADVTGVGAAADAGVASVKTLAIRFVGNPKAEKFLDVFIMQIKNAIAHGGGFGWAEANFLKKMVLDLPVADAFKLFMHDSALAKVAVRATEKLGENSEAFYQGVRRAVASHGEEVGAKFVRAFEGLGDQALAALKNAPPAELDEAFDALAKVANKGIAPATLSRVLDNAFLYGSQYTRTHLLKDLGELAEVKGIDLLVDTLKGANNKGFRYELEGAAWLVRNEKEVVELTKRIGGTDIDVVVLEGTKRIYYQFKRSSKAFYSGSKNTSEALELAKAWVSKAKSDLGRLATNDQIRYATDASVTVPKKILEWFNSLEPKIIVERIPHLD